MLTVLYYVYFHLVRVTVCATSFSPWCAKAAPQRESGESGSAETLSKTSQTPCPQPPAWHYRLSQERIMPGRVKSPDSVSPQLRVQDAGRSPLKRADCTAFEILHLALPRRAFCISGGGQIGLQKPCAGSRSIFPCLIRFTPQVFAGWALVEFLAVALLRRLRVTGRRRAPMARAKLITNLK